MAMSCVRSFATVKVLVDNKRVERHGGSIMSGATTRNIVYKEVLQLANEAY